MEHNGEKAALRVPIANRALQEALYLDYAHVINIVLEKSGHVGQYRYSFEGLNLERHQALGLDLERIASLIAKGLKK